MTVCNKLVFDPGKLSKPSLMIAGTAGAYSSEAPLMNTVLGQAPGLNNKH